VRLETAYYDSVARFSVRTRPRLRSHIRDKSIWLSRKADNEMKFHLPIAIGLNASLWVCNPVTLGLRSLPKLVATDIAV
jgi:hypothetical protein